MNVFTNEVRRSCVENVMNASNEIANVIDVIRGMTFLNLTSLIRE